MVKIIFMIHVIMATVFSWCWFNLCVDGNATSTSLFMNTKPSITRYSIYIKNELEIRLHFDHVILQDYDN